MESTITLTLFSMQVYDLSLAIPHYYSKFKIPQKFLQCIKARFVYLITHTYKKNLFKKQIE